MDKILKLVGLATHHSQERELAITPKEGRFRKKAIRLMAPLSLVLTSLLASCAAYGPYHPNTSSEPLNSVRGPADGRYKLAFIEFGDQGSALDTSQLTAALDVIHQAPRPLLFVYIHGWQNNANSGDVCRFEHFIDTVSRYPEITGRKINVIGVYIAWRGVDITFPVAKFLTFWSRKGAGGTIAAENGCLATLSELALAARAPEKKYHHCVLLRSFFWWVGAGEHHFAFHSRCQQHRLAQYEPVGHGRGV
jgi:hypothetical protein